MSPMTSTANDQLPRSFGLARLGYAAGALLMPKFTGDRIGLDTTSPAATAWARYFATREATLGAVVLATEDADPQLRRKLMLTCAAVDGVDLLTSLAVSVKLRSFRFFLMTFVPGAASVAVHLKAARELEGAQTVVI